MKKLALALTAVAAFTGSALAADLPARPYTKAPAVVAAPVPTWTGCYIGGGGGYGMWNQEATGFDEPPRSTVRTQTTDTVTFGGRGYFGTVQGGCDYQFGTSFVVGAFGDYDFANIHGNRRDVTLFTPVIADEKLSSQWAVGGRVGWLAFPTLLTYFSAGYTEAQFDRQNFAGLFVGQSSPGVFIDQRTYKGYFLGAGDEYALSFLPGLFWKTEYRVAQFDTAPNSYRFTSNGALTGFGEDSRKWVQTIRSELVYRFNFGGAVVARY